MVEIIWHWKRGNAKFYTNKIDVAEKALKEGLLVMGMFMHSPMTKHEQ